MSQHPRLVARLQHLIDESEHTVASLQRAAGISQTGVYDILDGSIRSPKLETIEKIAMAFDVSVAYLIGETSDKGASRLIGNYAKMSKRDRDILMDMAARLASENSDDQASHSE
jgi:transcriptional regulator with XRE-family HTH domain